MSSNAVALRDGGYYIVGKENQGDLFTSIWYLSNEYELSRKADGLKSVYSLALSGNNNWLYAFGYDTRRGFSYKVNKEHKDLLYGQEFYYIHVPDQSDGQKRHPQSVIILEERIWQRRMVFRSVIIMEEVKLFYPCREM